MTNRQLIASVNFVKFKSEIDFVFLGKSTLTETLFEEEEVSYIKLTTNWIV